MVAIVAHQPFEAAASAGDLRCLTPHTNTPAIPAALSTPTFLRCTPPHHTQVEGWGKSTPEMTLVGHTDQAQFPLATARSRPMVASGDDSMGGGGA
jgi:hypothetical protein